jgi:hypothetical protein
MGKPLPKTTAIELANSTSSKTEYQERLKRQRSHEVWKMKIGWSVA